MRTHTRADVAIISLTVRLPQHRCLASASMPAVAKDSTSCSNATACTTSDIAAALVNNSTRQELCENSTRQEKGKTLCCWASYQGACSRPMLPSEQVSCLCNAAVYSGNVPIWLVQQSIINRQQSTGLETCSHPKCQACLLHQAWQPALINHALLLPPVNGQQ